MVRAIITSEKHIVQINKKEVLALSRDNIPIATAVQDVGVGTDASEVLIGTLVKAVYVEIWIGSSANNQGTINALVVKTQQSAGLSFAQMQQLHIAPFKKNIFYTTQGLTPDSNTNPTPFIRQWIKIPKGKQRMGLGDEISLAIGNLDGAVDVQICGLAIYKAYT